MDHPLIDLINARIAAAEAEGAFDDLPGAGLPLAPDGGEDGVLNSILKRNGAVPEAVALSQELAKLRSELLEESDRSKRKTLVTEISLLQTKLDLARKS